MNTEVKNQMATNQHIETNDKLKVRKARRGTRMYYAYPQPGQSIDIVDASGRILVSIFVQSDGHYHVNTYGTTTVVQHESDMDKLWNRAVSRKGGLYNTESNFNRIGNEFMNLCKENGHTERDTRRYLQEHYESVARFFEKEVSQ